MNQDELLFAAKRGVAKRMGQRSHTRSQNQLLLIGGKPETIRDIAERSGLSVDVIRSRFRRGKREWSDFGVTT
jgi:hypothetical protein